MTEGVKGGDVNRPGSRSEIEKMPQTVCRLCGLKAVRTIVENGKCKNEVACQLRRERNARAKGGTS